MCQGRRYVCDYRVLYVYGWWWLLVLVVVLYLLFELSFIVIIFIQRMMSGLGKEIKSGLSLDNQSTQSFILENKQAKKGGVPEVTRESTEHSLQSLNGCQSNIVFNFDRKYYTPTFIQPNTQHSLPHIEQKYKLLFQANLQQQAQLKSQIFTPRPSSNLCDICKQNFEDYLKHTAHLVHQQKTNASKGQKLINDLVESFSRPVRKASTKAGQCELSELKKKRKVESRVEGRVESRVVKGMALGQSCVLPGGQNIQFQSNYQLF